VDFKPPPTTFVIQRPTGEYLGSIKGGGPLPVTFPSPLLPSPTSLVPSTPSHALSLRSRLPLIQLVGPGNAVSSPSCGSRQSPVVKRYLVHFELKVLLIRVILSSYSRKKYPQDFMIHLFFHTPRLVARAHPPKYVTEGLPSKTCHKHSFVTLSVCI